MSSDSSTPDDEAQTHETVSSAALNEDALVGLAADEDELSWRYKSALAPDSFKRHDECAEIDGEYYTKTLEVRDWPDNPQHGFFDRIISFQMPTVAVTLTTHFEGGNQREADRKLAGTADSLKQRVMSLARNKWIPDYFVDQVVGEYADVKRTQNTVSASEYSLYTSHTYLELRSPDRDALDTAVKRIRSRMQDVSADARPLKHHPQEGYQTVAPACKNYLGGNTKMTGEGLARLIPWTAENLIEPGGIELGINEDTGDPIILDLQNRETGFNVGIWGTIGSGKTTTLTRLLMRLKMKNPEMPMVIIDPKQEFAGLTWLFDGETVKVGTDTGINPLQIEETPPERLESDGDDESTGDQSPKRNAVRRSMDFVRSFYEYQGLSSSWEDVQGTWRSAIKEAYLRRGITDNPETHNNPSPTLKDDVFPIFAEMVKMPENFLEHSLADVDLSQKRMQKRADEIIHNHISALQEGGEFEHLSLETSIDIQNIDVLYLDLQNYENEVTAGLMMGPVLTAVLEQAKEVDEPVALAMDEFHYMLQNSSSLETLKQAYRHSRHSSLSMITATQSVEEFFTKNDEGERQLTEDASTLTNLMSVKIWHYLKEMDNEWAGEFDLTEAEQNHVEDADTGEPTAQALLELQKGGSYRLSVNFTDKLNPREFAMNQYDPTESDYGTDPLAYLDGYTDRNGRDVTEWTWSEPAKVAHSEDEQAHGGTELADGTTVTTDIADVDVTPTDDTASTEQDATGESSERGSDGRSETPDADAEADVETEMETEGEASPDDEDEDARVSLTDIGTVTARTASDLRASGFETVESVATAGKRALADVEGFDKEKAEFIREQAAEAFEDATATDTDTDTSRDTETGSEASSDAIAVTQDADTDDSPEAEEASPAETDADADTDATESGESDGIVGRMKGSLGSVFSHPAAGKSQPDLTDIGMVNKQKAAALRATGIETVTEVYTAAPDALAAAEGIDTTNAGYIQKQAEQALDASEVPIPESSDGPSDETGEKTENTDESAENASKAPQSSSPSGGAETPAQDDTPDATTDDEGGTDTDTDNDRESDSEGDADRETATATESESDTQLPLTAIQEVGDDRADVLREAGYESVEDVAVVVSVAGRSTLTEIEGIDGTRAETIAESANTLLDDQSDGTGAESAGGDE